MPNGRRNLTGGANVQRACDACGTWYEPHCRNCGRAAPHVQVDAVISGAMCVAAERLRYYIMAVDPECECRECPECGMLPRDCGRTDCANTCQCAPCDHCLTMYALAELERVTAEGRKQWSRTKD